MLVKKLAPYTSHQETFLSMRTFFLLGCLLTLSLGLYAQNPADIRVDMPHYVAIGPTCFTITAPSGYYLLVEGGILTERLRVANRNGANWADHVFDPAYPLMPLKDLEKFIQTNRHLPDVPSAQEVAADGIDVTQMQATMMAKIEELTLHVIRQEKQIAHLRRQLRVRKLPARSTH